MKKTFLLETIYVFLSKYYRVILGVIFVLLLVFNVFISYKYVYLTMKVQPEPDIERVSIDQGLLENVLADLEEREDVLRRVKTSSYPDPFN